MSAQQRSGLGFVGQSVPRIEDKRLLTGQGRYVADVDPERGPGFSHSSMVIEATIAGQGVALGRHSLAIDDIIAGRLVQPFGPNMPSTYIYSVVSPPEVADQDKVRLFREWLLEEAASGRAGLELRPLPSSA